MENSNTLLLTEVRKSLSISKSGRGKIQLPETNGKVADLPRNGKNYFFNELVFYWAHFNRKI